jgi:hypothetical protein
MADAGVVACVLIQDMGTGHPGQPAGTSARNADDASPSNAGPPASSSACPLPTRTPGT